MLFIIRKADLSIRQIERSDKESGSPEVLLVLWRGHVEVYLSKAAKGDFILSTSTAYTIIMGGHTKLKLVWEGGKKYASYQAAQLSFANGRLKVGLLRGKICKIITGSRVIPTTGFFTL